MAARSVCVTDVFDKSPITSFHIKVYTLCLLVIILDGFDLVVIGVTLPKIAQYLHASPTALGLAVGAGQMGPLIGAMMIGMLSDRWGRKKSLFISALIFGLFTMLTTTVGSVPQLALFRFLAGIGLGGAIPNALALGCEYAPSHRRAFITGMMWAGMPLGSVIAAFAAAWLLPHHGWQSLFWVGGIPPIVVGLMVAMFLPESLAFLVRQGKDKLAIRKIISRISPAMAGEQETEFYSNEKKLSGVPVKHLFTEGRAFTTIAVWMLFFLSFYLLWVMLSWTPTLLRNAGASIRQYSVAYAFLNLGSLIASLIIGRLMDKFDVYHVLEIWFVLAFITVSIFGLGSHNPFMVVAILAGITGLFVNGGNTGLMALGTISYPTSIRGSGIGWAYGVGKVGSMLGPVVGGVLLAHSWSVGRICVVNGLSGLLIAAIVVILSRHAAAARRKAVPEMASAASTH